MPNDKDTDFSTNSPKTTSWIFWGVMLGVIVLDYVTKTIAERALVPVYTPHQIVGEYLRLTLAYNPGAAFSIHFGSLSRWIFTVLPVIAVVVLWRLYRATPADQYLRALALSLVCGGAIGNLIDRLSSSRGVVDFIDVGIGVHRFPTFNVADMGVSVGATLLAWILLQEDRAAVQAAVHAPDR